MAKKNRKSKNLNLLETSEKNFDTEKFHGRPLPELQLLKIRDEFYMFAESAKCLSFGDFFLRFRLAIMAEHNAKFSLTYIIIFDKLLR